MEKKERYSSRILKTKLHVPHLRAEMIPRPALHRKLLSSIEKKLIIVSAPAGFGKSSLLSEWIRVSRITAGWVSLDKGDNDPVRFWEYIVAALGIYKADFGQNTLLLLHSARNSHPDSYIYTLIEELEQVAEEMVIVLDDYHEIVEPLIHQSMSTLLQHLPVHVHIILSTRVEHLFPLHQLRVRGELMELGIADLRFTAAELAQYFNGVLKLSLSEAEVQILHQRTEGWAAGIQLAALSMHGQQESAGLIVAQLSGNQRYIGEYLEAEVLGQHSSDTQLFLLRTALLKRMNGSLCDTLTGQTNGHDRLQQLEKSNSFIIPLDHEQSWYRYHHLFADLLRAELMKRFPGEVKLLHQRASGWYAKNGFAIEAIEHALEGEDYELAATLVEQEATYLLKKAEINTLSAWLDVFPQEWLNRKPMLSVIRAWCLILIGHLDEATRLLDALEQQLRQETSLSVQHIDELLAEIDVVRGYGSLVKGEHLDMLELFTASAQKKHNVSRFFELGLDLNSFEGSPIRGILGFKGALTKVQELYPQLRALFWNKGLAIVGYGAVIMGELLYEQNELDQVEYFFQRGRMLGEESQNIGVMVPASLTYVKYRLAKQDLKGAWELVEQVEEWIRRYGKANISHWINVCQALKALIWMREGNRKEIYRWLKQYPLSISEAYTVQKEFEQFTKVRAYLSVGGTSEALKLLNWLRIMTEKEKRLGSQIETQVLLAIGYNMQLDVKQALIHLNTALTLAEPEKYVRLFMDEAKNLLPLLSMYVRNEGEKTQDKEHCLLAYAAFLLQQMTQFEQAKMPPLKTIEPLTAREKEVLLLIDKGFTNKEIAHALGLSEGTVKGYCHKIFAKLLVSNRTQAIARLRELEAK